MCYLWDFLVSAVSWEPKIHTKLDWFITKIVIENVFAHFHNIYMFKGKTKDSEVLISAFSAFLNYPTIHDFTVTDIIQITIEVINIKARHNLINVKYCQMAFQSTRRRCRREFFGNSLVKQKWCTVARGRQPMKFVV